MGQGEQTCLQHDIFMEMNNLLEELIQPGREGKYHYWLWGGGSRLWGQTRNRGGRGWEVVGRRTWSTCPDSTSTRWRRRWWKGADWLVKPGKRIFMGDISPLKGQPKPLMVFFFFPWLNKLGQSSSSLLISMKMSSWFSKQVFSTCRQQNMIKDCVPDYWDDLTEGNSSVSKMISHTYSMPSLAFDYLLCQKSITQGV